MRRVHLEEHSAKRKRRLFAGRLEIAYRRIERVERLKEGKRPRKRRQIAGRANASRMEELRLLRLAEGKQTELRREYAHRLKGEFSGFVRDPRVRKSSK